MSADLVLTAHRAAVARLSLYAGLRGVQTRRGPGWWALRTGVGSNDLNGVVSAPGADITQSLAADLVGWFEGVPTCWLTWPADPLLTATLLAVGARPERTGGWSGGLLTDLLIRPVRPVVAVTSEQQLETWLELAAVAGWVETDHDRSVRRRLARELGLDHHALRHWLAYDEGQPVAFATSFCDGDVLELDALGVAAPNRRRGIGRNLVAAAWPPPQPQVLLWSCPRPPPTAGRSRSPWGSPTPRWRWTPASTSPQVREQQHARTSTGRA